MPLVNFTTYRHSIWDLKMEENANGCMAIFFADFILSKNGGVCDNGLLSQDEQEELWLYIWLKDLIKYPLSGYEMMRMSNLLDVMYHQQCLSEQCPSTTYEKSYVYCLNCGRPLHAAQLSNLLNTKGYAESTKI